MFNKQLNIRTEEKESEARMAFKSIDGHAAEFM